MRSTRGEDEYMFYCRKVPKGKNDSERKIVVFFSSIFPNTVIEIFTITFANTLIDGKFFAVHNTLSLRYLRNVSSRGFIYAT